MHIGDPVWLVIHRRRDPSLESGRDDKIVGLFSSALRAYSAVAHAKRLDGFRDHPLGFEIIELILGQEVAGDGIEIQG